MIIFGSVWFLSKKSNQTYFFKKNQNRFKPVGVIIFILAWFFPVLARFFWFGSVFPV